MAFQVRVALDGFAWAALRGLRGSWGEKGAADTFGEERGGSFSNSSPAPPSSSCFFRLQEEEEGQGCPPHPEKKERRRGKKGKGREKRGVEF